MPANTFNVSGVKLLSLILTDATTQLFFTGAVDGQELTLELIQDATGSRVVTSGNCPSIQQPNPAANSKTTQQLIYDASVNLWSTTPPSAITAGGQAPTTITVAGAVSKNSGLVLIGGTGATAVTLVAPVAGPPGVGDDGTEITFSCITAHAHTLTTPADKIGGAYDTVTFAAVGDAISFVANNGLWIATGGRGTNTLSEV